MTKEEFIKKCKESSSFYNGKVRRYIDIVVKKARRRMEEGLGVPKKQNNTQVSDEHIS